MNLYFARSLTRKNKKGEKKKGENGNPTKNRLI